MTEPYEQQDEESNQAFQAFTLYRDLPPQERSIKAAWDLYRELNGRPPRKVPDGGFNKWMKRWNWRLRALEWDRHLDRQRQIDTGDLRETHENSMIALVDVALHKWQEKFTNYNASKDSVLDLGRLVEILKELDDIKRRALGLPGTISSSAITADIIPHEIAVDLGLSEEPIVLSAPPAPAPALSATSEDGQQLEVELVDWEPGELPARREPPYPVEVISSTVHTSRGIRRGG